MVDLGQLVSYVAWGITGFLVIVLLQNVWMFNVEMLKARRVRRKLSEVSAPQSTNDSPWELDDILSSLPVSRYSGAIEKLVQDFLKESASGGFKAVGKKSDVMHEDGEGTAMQATLPLPTGAEPRNHPPHLSETTAGGMLEKIHQHLQGLAPQDDRSDPARRKNVEVRPASAAVDRTQEPKEISHNRIPTVKGPQQSASSQSRSKEFDKPVNHSDTDLDDHPEVSVSSTVSGL
ncbi:MAG: hypothetical protein LC793_19145 [Thermomicrobia bacterium]|nr:hypothetical protein [Thermomicrobia bacterium]